MERCAYTIEERHRLAIEEIKGSELYDYIVETGEYPETFKMCNECISFLAKRIREGRCNEDFSSKEKAYLSLIYNSMIEFNELIEIGGFISVL